MIGRVTAVLCAAFSPATDEAIYAVRDLVRAAGVPLPACPPHRPHLSLAAARVDADLLPRVLEVAASVAAEHDPIPVVLTEVGRFGRAGAVWLGPVATPELASLQRDVYRAVTQAGWESAFGDHSAPESWIAHCTLATRIAKPLLRDAQAAVTAGYTPIHGTVDALATILVGGRGDVGHTQLGAAPAVQGRTTPCPPRRVPSRAVE